MPTLLREHGFRFFFYMADRYEPPHVHVQRDDNAAKIWLDPVELAFADGFRRHEREQMLRFTKQHLSEFLAAWHRKFGGLDNE